MHLQFKEHLTLDGNGPIPLYRQIHQRVREAVETGLLRPGDRVPATRALAQELGLARGTVATAYKLLIAEGYVEARGQGGCVIAGRLASAAQTRQAVRTRPAPREMDGGASTPKPFQMGLPALDAFPRKTWARLAARAARATQLHHMVKESCFGAPELRSAIAGYLKIGRGIDCAPEQVFITSGYRSSMELVMRALLAPGEQVWIEEPAYPPTVALLRGAGLMPVPVPVDQEGLAVPLGLRLAPDARAAVVTPAHQSPLGATLSACRRRALLDWAAQKQAWLIEDDYDGEFRYVSRPLPALASCDTAGRVIHCGTFSKVLFPSIRLAYVVVPPALVDIFENTCSVIATGCPVLTQTIVSNFMLEGYFSRHVQRMRELYGERRQLAIDGLSSVLGNRLQFAPQHGGMHLLALTADGSDKALADRMREDGMAPQVLSEWYAGTPGQCGLLLGFTNISSVAQAAELGQRIARIMDE